jgi:hypothetical protein
MIEFTEENREPIQRWTLHWSPLVTECKKDDEGAWIKYEDHCRKLAERPAEKCCQNCVEVKPDVVTLPDWPAGTGPCDLCLICIGLMLDGRRKELDAALADSTEGGEES